VRLLVYGHWSHTGFGIVTNALVTRFVAAGIDARVIAVNHRGEPVKGPLAGRVWPANIYNSGFGGDWSAGAIDGSAWTTLDPDDEWKPDAVLVISDVSGLIGHIGQSVDPWRTLPVYHYCPIEGDNLSPAWRGVWTIFQPVAMSDFGARVIGEHIGREVPRIYHGVDSESFYPVSPGKPIRFDGGVMRSKDDCKRKFEMDPDRLVILRADRNVDRKNYPALLQAFHAITQARDDVDLVLHCRPIDREGPDLIQELSRYPEDFVARVKFTGAHDTFKGLSTAGLNVLYNAADLYMSTTGGEGFGLTLAEAASCGVPVICTDWAAEREVVAEGGVLIPPLHDSYGEPVRYHSGYGMDWAVPDPKAFVEPALRLLSHPGHRKSIGAAGRLHIQRSFSWDVAAAQFLDLFTTPLEAVA
jgi:glycosyltransferase involved in cell wall biosynthesis